MDPSCFIFLYIPPCTIPVRTIPWTQDGEGCGGVHRWIPPRVFSGHMLLPYYLKVRGHLSLVCVYTKRHKIWFCLSTYNRNHCMFRRCDYHVWFNWINLLWDYLNSKKLIWDIFDELLFERLFAHCHFRHCLLPSTLCLFILCCTVSLYELFFCL